MAKSVDSPVTRREEAAARRAHKDVHDAERRAVDTALKSATALSQVHNDLLRRMTEDRATFVTRDLLDVQLAPLRRLVYMGLGMAVLLPALIGLFLALTR